MSIVQAFAERIASTITREKTPLFVAICGWADTGKSTLAAELCSAISCSNIDADWISTDAFLRNRADRNRLGISGYNPLSIDAKELSIALNRLTAQHDYVYYPYDNRTGNNVLTSKTIFPKPVVVIEGIHAFHDAVWNLCRLRIFIDSDEGTLRAVREKANVCKRGMSSSEASMRIDSELEEYQKYVSPKKSLANVSVNVSSNYEYLIQDDSF